MVFVRRHLITDRFGGLRNCSFNGMTDHFKFFLMFGALIGKVFVDGFKLRDFLHDFWNYFPKIAWKPIGYMMMIFCWYGLIPSLILKK